MKKISEIYGPDIIKLGSFNDVVTSIGGVITAAEYKRFDNGERLVVTLGNNEYSFVVNATNGRAIGAVYGDDPEDWIGKRIETYPGKLFYQGNEQPGVCVRIPEPTPEEVANLLANQAAREAKAAEDLTDDIPF